jgi:hypothetical protein
VEALLDIAEGERDEAFEQVTRSKEEELRMIEEAMEHSERARLLEVENSNLRDNMRAMAQFEDDGAEGEDDVIPSEVQSWDDIAEFLPELSGPGFHLSDRALDCADGSGRYPRPDAMWRALRALTQTGSGSSWIGLGPSPKGRTPGARLSPSPADLLRSAQRVGPAQSGEAREVGVA